MQLPKKPQTFFKFSLCLSNLDKVLNNLKKKMSLIAYVFAKMLTLKDVVT